MSTSDPSALRERVLECDDDLAVFLDDRQRLGDPIMPMDDYPENPDGIVSTDDLGDLPHAGLLVHRAEMIRGVSNNAAIVFVWERLGPRSIDKETAAWARSMAQAARELGAPLRAQFLLHDGGIRQLYPDDYIS